MMFDYDKLFEPYTADGASVDGTIKWLKKTVNCDDRVIDQVVSDTMQLLSQGVDFTGPCECGCDMKNVHTKINHFMLAKAFDIKSKAEKAYVKVLEEVEKTRLEARQKQLSNFDKEYAKMRNGTFWNKFKKFVGAPYEKWETE